MERIGDDIRAKGLLPSSERNDSFIIAEAALCDCDLLITSDGEMTSIGLEPLAALLKSFHVKPVGIIWPQLVRRMNLG